MQICLLIDRFVLILNADLHQPRYLRCLTVNPKEVHKRECGIPLMCEHWREFIIAGDSKGFPRSDPEFCNSIPNRYIISVVAPVGGSSLTTQGDDMWVTDKGSDDDVVERPRRRPMKAIRDRSGSVFNKVDDTRVNRGIYCPGIVLLLLFQIERN